MRISDWSSDVCSSDLLLICRLDTVLKIDEKHAADWNYIGRRSSSRQRYFLSPSTWKRSNRSLPPNSHPRSEEHTSELQSLMRISYAVFCLKKKKNNITTTQLLSPTYINNNIFNTNIKH